MSDFFHLDVGQSIQSAKGVWYRNLQLLGAGGNAVTFLAVATSGQNRGVLFAIKVFRKLSRPERREGFLKEISFLESCEHPSIVRVFDTGVFRNDYPFFVAEYLPQTLHQVLRTADTSVVVKISFALQLLSALAYLETLEPPVIHRDIKPRNVFVKGRSCVLGDFGLMKRMDTSPDEGFLKESLGAGMPYPYRSPDQVAYLKGVAPLSAKSDVFQLGLVLAEMFTGKNPERAAQDLDEPVVLDALGTVPGALSGAIVSAINRMLERDPTARDPASRLLAPWEGVFKNAVKSAYALEGRAM